MVASTSAFVAPAFKFGFAFSAYNSKKYRRDLPGDTILGDRFAEIVAPLALTVRTLLLLRG